MYSRFRRFIAVSSSNHPMLSAATHGLYGISFYDPTTFLSAFPTGVATLATKHAVLKVKCGRPIGAANAPRPALERRPHRVPDARTSQYAQSGRPVPTTERGEGWNSKPSAV